MKCVSLPQDPKKHYPTRKKKPTDKVRENEDSEEAPVYHAISRDFLAWRCKACQTENPNIIYFCSLCFEKRNGLEAMFGREIPTAERIQSFDVDIDKILRDYRMVEERVVKHFRARPKLASKKMQSCVGKKKMMEKMRKKKMMKPAAKRHTQEAHITKPLAKSPPKPVARALVAKNSLKPFVKPVANSTPNSKPSPMGLKKGEYVRMKKLPVPKSLESIF